MAYRVISFFKDRKDNRYAYHVGDIFPRHGASVTKERVQELLGCENRQKKPLIEEITDDSFWEKCTKTDINRMTTAELKAFAKEQNIDAVEDMTGIELKQVLIKKLKL